MSTEHVADMKVHQILKGLSEGKSREQLAEEMEYKSYKSLDIFMRRKGYDWDKRQKNYYPKSEEQETFPEYPKGRAGSIITMLRGGGDIKEVAKHFRFDDHRAMAIYMAGKGFYWDQESQNYAFRGSESESESTQDKLSSHEPSKDKEEEKKREGKVEKNKKDSEFERFLPILEFLEKNEEALRGSISLQSNIGSIPRYTLPGISTTKSIHMVWGLEQLIREYSKEKNIPQKEIVEIALIEFFRKYGYHREVETLIGKQSSKSG
jgi:hypothetical protein